MLAGSLVAVQEIQNVEVQGGWCYAQPISGDFEQPVAIFMLRRLVGCWCTMHLNPFQVPCG